MGSRTQVLDAVSSADNTRGTLWILTASAFPAGRIGLARFATCLPNPDQLDRQVDILLAVLADIGWPGTGSASLGKLGEGWIMFVEPKGFIQDGQASQERS